MEGLPPRMSFVQVICTLMRFLSDCDSQSESGDSHGSGGVDDARGGADEAPVSSLLMYLWLFRNPTKQWLECKTRSLRLVGRQMRLLRENAGERGAMNLNQKEIGYNSRHTGEVGVSAKNIVKDPGKGARESSSGPYKMVQALL